MVMQKDFQGIKLSGNGSRICRIAQTNSTISSIPAHDYRLCNCKVCTLESVHKGREWPIGDIEAHMKTHMFCCMTYEDFGTLRRSVSIILPRLRTT